MVQRRCHGRRWPVATAAQIPTPLRLLHCVVHLAHTFPWHALYFFPLPQGQGSLRPTLSPTLTGC